MFYHDKPLEKEDFFKLFPKSAIGAEIGVFKGEFTKMMLEVAKPARLHLIDVWWEKHGEFYPDWGEDTESGQLKTADAYSMMLQNIEEKKANCEIHIGNCLRILETFPVDYLDWAYLHSDYSDTQTKQQLEILADSVKTGGLITGRDWQRDEIANAIDEFCTAGKWKVVYIDDWNQWCLMNKGN